MEWRTCRWLTRPSALWRPVGNQPWATSAATRSSTRLNPEEKNEWYKLWCFYSFRLIWRFSYAVCSLEMFQLCSVDILTYIRLSRYRYYQGILTPPFPETGGSVSRNHHHYPEELGSQYCLQCGRCSRLPRCGGHTGGREGKDKWVTQHLSSRPRGRRSSQSWHCSENQAWHALCWIVCVRWETGIYSRANKCVTYLMLMHPAGP